MIRALRHGAASTLLVIATLAIAGGLILALGTRAGPLAGTRAALASGTPTMSLPKANDPERDLRERLALRPGGKCTAWLDAYLVPLATAGVDAAVAAAGGPGHWLVKDVWIGEADSAATAFGATWGELSSKSDMMWIETTRTGKSSALLLRSETTSGGATLWRIGGSAQIAPCSSDGE